MKFLKLVLIGIVVVFLAFIGMKVLGVAFRILMSMFWLAMIGLIALAVWKMFSSKGSKQVENAEPKSKFQDPEMTLEEYKRKIEAQLRSNTEK
jgi:purine-cytosine permease-like protein